MLRKRARPVRRGVVGKGPSPDTAWGAEWPGLSEKQWHLVGHLLYSFRQDRTDRPSERSGKMVIEWLRRKNVHPFTIPHFASLELRKSRLKFVFTRKA